MDHIETYLNSRPLADTTRQQYTRLITAFLAAHPQPGKLTAAELRHYLYTQPWGSAARWRGYSILRGYLRHAHPESPALSLRIKRERSGPQRSLSADQVQKLLLWFDPSTHLGIRDKAICLLLLDTGLRESEICRLELKGLKLHERTLGVLCKGSQYGYAVYSAATAEALHAWIAIRKQHMQPALRSLFCGILGCKPGTPITPGGLRANVRRWGKESGIGPLSPHDFRRTFCQLALRAGAPTRIVQIGGRWRSLDMVELYSQNLELDAFRPYLPVDYILSL